MSNWRDLAYKGQNNGESNTSTGSWRDRAYGKGNGDTVLQSIREKQAQDSAARFKALEQEFPTNTGVQSPVYTPINTVQSGGMNKQLRIQEGIDETTPTPTVYTPPQTVQSGGINKQQRILDTMNNDVYTPVDNQYHGRPSISDLEIQNEYRNSNTPQQQRELKLLTQDDNSIQYNPNKKPSVMIHGQSMEPNGFSSDDLKGLLDTVFQTPYKIPLLNRILVQAGNTIAPGAMVNDNGTPMQPSNMSKPLNTVADFLGTGFGYAADPVGLGMGMGKAAGEIVGKPLEKLGLNAADRLGLNTSSKIAQYLGTAARTGTEFAGLNALGTQLQGGDLGQTAKSAGEGFVSGAVLGPVFKGVGDLFNYAQPIANLGKEKLEMKLGGYEEVVPDSGLWINKRGETKIEFVNDNGNMIPKYEVLMREQAIADEAARRYAEENPFASDFVGRRNAGVYEDNVNVPPQAENSVQALQSGYRGLPQGKEIDYTPRVNNLPYGNEPIQQPGMRELPQGKDYTQKVNVLPNGENAIPLNEPKKSETKLKDNISDEIKSLGGIKLDDEFKDVNDYNYWVPKELQNENGVSFTDMMKTLKEKGYDSNTITNRLESNNIIKQGGYYDFNKNFHPYNDEHLKSEFGFTDNKPQLSEPIDPTVNETTKANTNIPLEEKSSQNSNKEAVSGNYKVGDEIAFKINGTITGGKLTREVAKDMFEVEYEDNKGKHTRLIKVTDGKLQVTKSEPTSKEQLPMDNRDMTNVGDRKVKSYQYLHPELKTHIQSEANIMLGELNNSLKGQRSGINVNGENHNTSNQRITSQDIASLLDEKYAKSYAEIEKALKSIIEDHGAENTALAKRIEVLIDNRLSNGYHDFITGHEVPKNEQYVSEKSAIDGKKETQVEETPKPEEDVKPVEEVKPKNPQKVKLYRGEIKPSEIAGKDKNIQHMKTLEDVADNLSPENIVKRFENIKEDTLKSIDELNKKLSNGYDYSLSKQLENLKDNLKNAEKMIDSNLKIIKDRSDREQIIKDYSDLLYLTSQIETARAYANQLEDKPELLFPKPEGYSPVIREFEANFDNLLDLSNFERGFIPYGEVETVLSDLGYTEQEIEDFINREDTENNVPTFRLFRDKNLPITMKHIKENGYDAVKYTEGKQDNYLIVDRNKVNEINKYPSVEKPTKINEESKTEIPEQNSKYEITLAVYDGARIIENYEDNRTQIVFNEKPSEKVMDILKRSGWIKKNNTVWHKELTNSSEINAKSIVSKFYTENKNAVNLKSDLLNKYEDKETWETPLNVFAANGFFTPGVAKQLHRDAVKKAIEEGKYIPEEVMTYYPDMVSKKPQLAKIDNKTYEFMNQKLRQDTTAAGKGHWYSVVNAGYDTYGNYHNGTMIRATTPDILANKVKTQLNKETEIYSAKKPTEEPPKDENKPTETIKSNSDGVIVDENNNPITLYHGSPNKFEEFDMNKLGENTGANSAKEGIFFTSSEKVAKSYNFNKQYENPQTSDELMNFIKSLNDDDFNKLSKHIDQKTDNPDLDSELDGFDRNYATKIIKNMADNFDINESIDGLEEIKKYIRQSLGVNFEEKQKWEPNIYKVNLSMKNPIVKDFKSEDFEDYGFTDLLKQAKENGNDGAVFKSVYDSAWGIAGKSDVYVVFDKSQVKMVKPEAKEGTSNTPQYKDWEIKRGYDINGKPIKTEGSVKEEQAAEETKKLSFPEHTVTQRDGYYLIKLKDNLEYETFKELEAKVKDFGGFYGRKGKFRGYFAFKENPESFIEKTADYNDKVVSKEERNADYQANKYEKKLERIQDSQGGNEPWNSEEPFDKNLIRRANENWHFGDGTDYNKDFSRERENAVNKVNEIKSKTDNPELLNRLDYELERFKKDLYNNYYDWIRNDASMPSVMIAGPAKYNTRKADKVDDRRFKLVSESKEIRERFKNELSIIEKKIGQSNWNATPQAQKLVSTIEKEIDSYNTFKARGDEYFTKYSMKNAQKVLRALTVIDPKTALEVQNKYNIELPLTVTDLGKIAAENKLVGEKAQGLLNLPKDKKNIAGVVEYLYPEEKETIPVAESVPLSKEVYNMSEEELFKAINESKLYETFKPLEYQVDWGKKERGQGKRSGTMVKGAMSDAPTGVKTYIDYLGNVPEFKDQSTGSYDNREKLNYLHAREFGLNHHQAMLYMIDRRDFTHHLKDYLDKNNPYKAAETKPKQELKPENKLIFETSDIKFKKVSNVEGTTKNNNTLKLETGYEYEDYVYGKVGSNHYAVIKDGKVLTELTGVQGVKDFIASRIIPDYAYTLETRKEIGNKLAKIEDTRIITPSIAKKLTDEVEFLKSELARHEQRRKVRAEQEVEDRNKGMNLQTFSDTPEDAFNPEVKTENKPLPMNLNQLNNSREYKDAAAYLERKGLNYENGVSKEQFDSIPKEQRKFIANSMVNSLPVSEEMKKDFLEHPEWYEYIMVNNEQTLNREREYVEKNFDRTVMELKKLTSLRNEVDTARAIEVLKHYIENGEFEKANDWSLRVAKMGTNTGRAIQYFSVMKRFDAAWTLNHIQKKIENSISKSDKEKLTDKSFDVAGNLNNANTEAIESIGDILKNTPVEKMLEEGRKIKKKKAKEESQEIVEQTSILPKEIKEELTPEEKLAKKVENYVKNSELKEDDPINNMVNTLFKVAKEVMPEKAKNFKSAKEFINEAMANAEEYKRVWDEAKKIVEDKVGDNPIAVENLNEYFDTFLDRPFADKQLTQAVKDSIKELDIDLTKLVKEHYSKVNMAGESIKDVLVSKGLDGTAAEQLGLYIADKFNQLTRDKKEQILSNMFKDRPKYDKKKWYQRVIELSNLGAFDSSAYRTLVAEKLKMPHLSNEDSMILVKLANRVQELPEGRLKREAKGKLIQYMDSKIKRTPGMKINAVQTMNMLLNSKTSLRNTLSNVAFGGQTAVKNVVKTGLDAAIGGVKVGNVQIGTGKRTTALPSPVSYAKGLAEGTKEAALDFMHNVNTQNIDTKLELRSGSVFTKGPLGFLERLTRLVLDDRPFKGAAIEAELKRMKKVADKNGEEFNEADALEKAKLEANFVTFNDENKISNALLSIKRALNLKKSWGFGDMLLKFARTPANIFVREIQYSPYSFAEALFRAAYDGFKDHKFDQEKFVESLARGITGTGILGLGIMLQKLGVIIINNEPDKDKYTFDSQTGKGKFKINFSAIQRIIGKGKLEKQNLEIGDNLASYDWLVPFAANLTLGAVISESKDRNSIKNASDLLSNYVESTAEGLNGLVEQPMLKGLQTFASSKNIMNGALDVVLSVPQSFVPSSLNQIRQLIDNKTRETYNPNVLTQSKNKALNRIPYLENMLPQRVDSLGRPKETYQDSLNNFLNVFLNPAITTRYSVNDAEKVVENIYNNTGEKIQYPRVVDNKVEINKDMPALTLTPTEYIKYQTYVGQQTLKLLNTMTALNEGEHTQKEYEDAAKYISNEMNKINENAKLGMLVDRKQPFVKKGSSIITDMNKLKK